MVATTVSAAVGLLLAQAALAGDCCTAPGACEQVVHGSPDNCGHCGVQACCKKVCKVVCEMKEVTKHCWCVECEDFCAPLPNCAHGCSDPGCCDPGCDPGCDVGGCTAEGCGSCAGSCGQGHDLLGKLGGLLHKPKCLVPPKCGKVRTKKKLVKKEYKCKVPVYKCVVVYTCPGCCDPACGESGCALPATGGDDAQPAAPAPAPAEEEAPLPPEPKASTGPNAFPAMTSLQTHLRQKAQ
jgi:hypothetical protein